MYISTNDVIKTYLELGFSIFPCQYKGKIPATKHGCKDATKDANQLKQLIGNRNVNLAIATGEPSNVFVLDVDNADDLAKLQAKHGNLPATWIVETGSGGKHYYFRFDDRCKTLKNAVKFAGSLDIRTTGGYVLAPPSIHANGNPYRWLVKPTDCELASAPDWLLALIPNNDGKYVVKEADDEYARAVKYLERVSPAVQGNGGMNDTFKVCCYLIELFGNLSDDELYEAMQDWNSRCVPIWSEKELRRKIAEARKKVGVEPTEEQDEEEEDAFPVLHPNALYGLAGEIVSAIEPETEADTVGILTTLFTFFGNAVGSGAYCQVGTDVHPCKLFACLVGDTGCGKEQTLGIASYLFKKADPQWYKASFAEGLSTGEGLISRVADPPMEQGNPNAFVLLKTKQLMVAETEFARPLTAMGREGNTLASVIRQAWSRDSLEVMTKVNPLKASNVLISLIGHTTGEELQRAFAKGTQKEDGFVNRFLWVMVKNGKSLPFGGNPNPILDSFAPRLQQALTFAKTVGLLQRDKEADRVWGASYENLKSQGKTTSRARPYVLRLSAIYALLDCSNVIRSQHVQAALALWNYCEQSAHILFANKEAVGLPKKIVDVIKKNKGVKKSELRSAVSNNIPTKDFDYALSSLERRGETVAVKDGQATLYYPSIGNPIENVAKPSATASDWQNAIPTVQLAPAYRQPKTLSFGKLMDWKNAHGIRFHRSETGIVEVVPEQQQHVTPAIAETIKQNQEMLAVFVSSKPDWLKPLPKNEGEAWARIREEMGCE